MTGSGARKFHRIEKQQPTFRLARAPRVDQFYKAYKLSEFEEN